MGKIGLILIIVLVVLIAVACVLLYNSMVKVKNKVDQAFADIDTVLKKRYDLVPNLVNTVKGYAKHEKETLTQTVELRNSAMSAKSSNEKIDANNKLASSITSIIALAENYPDLKADTNFLSLQNSLQDIENELATLRRSYNDTATAFNSKLETFPNNIICALFGFKKSSLFEITNEKERENVKVEF